MIDLDNFDLHLLSIIRSDWFKLFDLLPEIEAAESFGTLKSGQVQQDDTISFPYWEASDLVDKALQQIFDLKLMPVFDWAAWDEGKSLLKNPTFDCTSLNTRTLCKLLTVIIRADRYNEGFLVTNFENGVMLKIIRALKNNEIDEKNCY
ncbi:MAG TPA: DUF6508 domain-containing protein [Saprospiraceae bacterium]|nr:DUF6508 domain-containing protein [Saprospiraceae bacterium]